LLVRVSKFKVLRVVLDTRTSTLEAKDQCLRVYGVKQDKGTRFSKDEDLKTRGKGSKVLQR
jgi:hypothetical protein